jgi:peptide/nickel transport system permease protein
MSTASALPNLASAADAAPQRVGRARRHWMNPSLMTGLVFLGMIVVFAVGYPFVVDWNPTEPDFAQPTFAGPSWDHPLGTDNFGRDTLTRLAHGGRIDLVLAFIATAVTVIVGGILGLVGGYVGGWFDTFVMRLVDFAVTIPYLILVIAIVAILGPGTSNLVYAIWLVGWVTYARIVRA